MKLGRYKARLLLHEERVIVPGLEEYKGKQTASGDALTSLIPDLFRLTSLLLTAGDRLVARLELTSARWQILGTVAPSERAQPVAWLARNMGRIAKTCSESSMTCTTEKAGAKGRVTEPAPTRAPDYHPNVAEAIRRSSDLLAASSQKVFTEGGGCVGCHHQPMAGRAFAALRAGGLQPDPRLRQVLMDGLIAERPLALNRLPQLVAGNGDMDGMLFRTVAMAELGEPANSMTDAIVHFVASRQNPSGSWDITQGGRPPMEDTPFTRTMMAAWTLKTYGWPARRADFQERLTRARKWLLSAYTR